MNNAIRRILKFDNVVELIQESKPELVDKLDPEIFDFLQHVFDFEPFVFILINDDTVLVIDCLNGDAIGPEMSLDDYIQQLVEYAQEEVKT